MTQDLGRIARLKYAIDSLTVIREAVFIINSETDIDFFKNPEKSYHRAKSKLAELKKQ